MTKHIDAGEHIKAHQEQIDRLRAELQQERSTSARLRAALREVHQHVAHNRGEDDDVMIVN